MSQQNNETEHEELLRLRRQAEADRAKLDYVHSMGLRFGMMKTSDKPEPYLAHTWTEDPDYERMFRDWSHSIGWETEVEKLKTQLASADKDRERLDWLESSNNLAIDHSFWAEHMPNAGKLIITLMEMDEDSAEVIDEIAKGDSIRAAIDSAMQSSPSLDHGATGETSK